MRKVLVIALRDYQAAVRSKSFLVSLLLMPVLMFGGAAVQIFLDKRGDTQDKKFAIIDRTPGAGLYDRLAKAAEKRTKTTALDPVTQRQIRPYFKLTRVEPSADTTEAIEEQRLELSDEVRADKYWGFLDIGSQVGGFLHGLEPIGDKNQTKPDNKHSIRYQTNHPTFEEFPTWVQQQLMVAIVSQELGISADSMLSRPQSMVLHREGLSERDRKTGAIVDPPMINQIARFLTPAALVFLMFMMIMLSSTPAMHGVVEEKMQRIAEVLLGSVTPFTLMLGKILGLIGVSVTMACVYLGGAYVAAIYYGLTEFLPPLVLVWFFVFQMLAVMMYGSAFLAIGAAASDVKETQTLVMPVILIACIPMFILRNALEDPNNPLVVWISFFPPVTPMLMMARIAISPGPAWWQPFLSVALAIATTMLCVYAAGRIFRIGILLQGKGARLGQLLSWVFRG